MNNAMRSSSLRRWALLPCIATVTLGLACLAPRSSAASSSGRLVSTAFWIAVNSSAVRGNTYVAIVHSPSRR